jgi:L-fuculose-phosphate aldolase
VETPADAVRRARQEIVTFAHKMQERGFVAATDGNLSIRLGPDRFLITPSGLPKGDMTVDAPIVIDGEGSVVEGSGAASVETKLHLECYRRRDDVQAVIHAHPPKCIAFTLAGVPVVTLGQVPVSPYATPSTEEVPVSIRDIIPDTDAIILARHGTVTVGPTLEAAFRKLEKLEQTAEISFYAHMLGGVVPFRKGELEKLQGLRDVWGVKGRAVPCTTDGCGFGRCAARVAEKGASPAAPALDEGEIRRLVETIVEQITKNLGSIRGGT